jgi:hypothetical protein
MRKVIATILISVFATPAFAGSWTTEDLQQQSSKPGWQEVLAKKIRQNEAFRNYALKEVIGGRCIGWLAKPFKELRQRNKMVADCRSSLDNFFSVLQPKLFTFVLPESGSEVHWTVVFGDELQALILDPRVSDFLISLKESMDSPQPADLYETAKKFAGSDYEALRWIAILFQDTSKPKTHIQFLKVTNPEPSDLLRKNVMSLVAAIDRMNEILSHGDSGIRLYPDRVEARNRAGFSPALYHYYVPAYVSARSVSNGSPVVSSFFVSFIFNYLYEAIEAGNPVLRGIWEPSSMSMDSVKDVYMGYVGAYGGAELKPDEWNIERFAKIFSQHPFTALEEMSREVTRGPLD